MLNTRTARLAAIAVGILVMAPDARAQQPRPIPPVEVVATRLPEQPHDVAASIEVISGEDLRARGVTTLREALALATGVSIAPGGDQGPASAVPAFWGLREFDAFLLVVDDIPWGGALNPEVATLNLHDVERIEVLRGPAPVTYGATSFVGVIHVVHNAAAAKAKYAELRGGAYGTGGAAVDIPMPLGSWNSRLSAAFDREGFKDDHTSYSRGSATWRTGKVDGRNRMWASADLTVLRQEPASPHPRQGATLSTAVPRDANHNPANAFLDDNRFNLAAGYERPIMTDVAWTTMASYTFSGKEMFRGFLTNVANAANNASGFKENIDINDIYVDSHLIWPAINNVRFLAGADLLFAAGEAKGATFTYTAPLNGSAQAGVAEPSNLNLDSEDERRFLGAYGAAEWKPMPTFTLSGGLRLNATAEKRGETSKEATNTRVSGDIGAIYSLWELNANHLKVFANYRNTFKPAAFDFGLAENEGILKPETSMSYEGGVKGRFMDGRLDVEASAFRMDFENLVTATVVGGQPALINAGTTRFQGFELEADARLPYSLSVRGSVALHDPKFVDFVQAFDNVPTQLGGKRFEMSPKQLASAGLVLAPERGFIAHAVANYTGDRYLNKRNTALVKSFTTFDAGVGYRMDRYELRLDGRNLGDARDAVSESEFGDAQYYLMPARSIRAGLSVSW